jgi:hypothetical protein
LAKNIPAWMFFSQSGHGSAKSKIIQPNIVPNAIQPNVFKPNVFKPNEMFLSQNFQPNVPSSKLDGMTMNTNRNFNKCKDESLPSFIASSRKKACASVGINSEPSLD